MNATLNFIETELIEKSRDNRYSIAAYEFVLQGFEYTRTVFGDTARLSSEKLMSSIYDFGRMQFGPLQKEVFKSWGIASHIDFGNIIYNMISLRILRKSQREKIDDFYEMSQKLA